MPFSAYLGVTKGPIANVPGADFDITSFFDLDAAALPSPRDLSLPSANNAIHFCPVLKRKNPEDSAPIKRTRFRSTSDTSWNRKDIIPEYTPSPPLNHLYPTPPVQYLPLSSDPAGVNYKVPPMLASAIEPVLPIPLVPIPTAIPIPISISIPIDTVSNLATPAPIVGRRSGRNKPDINPIAKGSNRSDQPAIKRKRQSKPKPEWITLPSYVPKVADFHEKTVRLIGTLGTSVRSGKGMLNEISECMNILSAQEWMQGPALFESNKLSNIFGRLKRSSSVESAAAFSRMMCEIELAMRVQGSVFLFHSIVHP